MEIFELMGTISIDTSRALSAINTAVRRAASARSSITASIRGITSAAAEAAASAVSRMRSNAASGFSGIRSAITGQLGGACSAASSSFSAIASAASGRMQSARTAVSGAVEAMKSAFHFEWSLPAMKLPHFSVSPAGWKAADLLEGIIPSLSISWYRRAMQGGMILKKPAIFGYDPASGSLMGGGEAGSEAVVGTESLENMIASAVESRTGSISRQLESLSSMLEDRLSDLQRRAAEDTVVKLDRREFARLVRSAEHA